MNLAAKGAQESNKKITVVVGNVEKHLKSSMTTYKSCVLTILRLRTPDETLAVDHLYLAWIIQTLAYGRWTGLAIAAGFGVIFNLAIILQFQLAGEVYESVQTASLLATCAFWIGRCFDGIIVTVFIVVGKI